MSCITNPQNYTIAFMFYETDTVQDNQTAAGNNLFSLILQKYGHRLEECQADQWRFFLAITQCLHANGERLYQELLDVLEKTGLFHQSGLFQEPQLFEWIVFEETAEGLKFTSKHSSDTLELFRRYKGRIFL
ncbi:hypothetical protein FVEG_10661 [Fusarium verticillioides 7600]|uniref:Uncharacterized protein n=1 Tax=Gibberella moniliformis (strain M3125 / FGSC 7600) TaxID=334819 RepID=W7MK60_GIBM7|nr:hypothetical protein FVEG_10661 [Fusarium verticillioides 7600]EWG51773.1 hypothetical protein FVEG_10661 [Fusarium verticillioides 7600]